MKITENLKLVINAIGTREISVNELATELKKTTNSVRSTISVTNYKEYFIVNNNNIVNDKIVKLYKLSPKGLDLLNNKEEEK